MQSNINRPGSHIMKSKVALVMLLATAALGGSLPLRAAAGGTPRVIKIRAGVENAVKYDVASISAAPGEAIKVVLTNAGTLPKNVMGHDWVLLTADSDPAAFAAAAATAPDNGYIPAQLKGKVLAFIAVLGPGETGEVTFTAPSEPGQYPFLCTFPGHYVIGMKGMLVVKK